MQHLALLIDRRENFTMSNNNDHSGDFNCVLKNTDSTGNINFRKALQKIESSFGLDDEWKTDPLKAVYTHYT
jgi:hypothetical protein